MKCLICGKDSAGEVCNQCIRMEQVIYSKEWSHKEGLLVKKVEEFKVTISNARISGLGAISTSSSGLNARVDSFSHYIGSVVNVGSGTYAGKTAPMVSIKNKETGMERYIVFPFMEDPAGLDSAVKKAKSEILGSGAGASSAGAADPAAQEKLNKLNLLKASGILSEAEYQREKTKLGL